MRVTPTGKPEAFRQMELQHEKSRCRNDHLLCAGRVRFSRMCLPGDYRRPTGSTGCGNCRRAWAASGLGARALGISTLLGPVRLGSGLLAIKPALPSRFDAVAPGAVGFHYMGRRLLV